MGRISLHANSRGCLSSAAHCISVLFASFMSLVVESAVKRVNIIYTEHDPAQKPIYNPRDLRIICIGAGISGLCFADKLQRSFENFELVIYEKNAQVSGTWFKNTYPT